MNDKLKSYFPLFVNITDKKVLVVGAGEIATRRINTLTKFDCKINVIAPIVSKEVEELALQGKITCIKRAYEDTDMTDVDILIGATNNRELNHKLYLQGEANEIYYSIADCKEECNFYFPAIIETENTVIGITAEGKSHKSASMMTQKIKEYLDEN